jgi:hypothetical protein
MIGLHILGVYAKTSFCICLTIVERQLGFVDEVAASVHFLQVPRITVFAAGNILGTNAAYYMPQRTSCINICGTVHFPLDRSLG